MATDLEAGSRVANQWVVKGAPAAVEVEVATPEGLEVGAGGEGKEEGLGWEEAVKVGEGCAAAAAEAEGTAGSEEEGCG